MWSWYNCDLNDNKCIKSKIKCFQTTKKRGSVVNNNNNKKTKKKISVYKQSCMDLK